MKFIYFRLLIVILVFFLFGCNGNVPTTNTNNNTVANSNNTISGKPFVVAIPTYPGFALPYLAQNKGFFKDLNVQLVRMDDSAAINAGMERGDIDACFTSTDAFVLLAGANIKAKAVLLSDESKGADGIVAKERIKTINDLKGKKVAANLGWPGHFFLLYNLKKAGISFNDVQITNLDADKAGAAFISGDLDAAVTWEPWLSKATSTAGGHILVSTSTLPGIIVDVMIVRNETIANKAGDVQTFIDGYYQALQTYKADKSGSIAIMAKAFELKPEDFEGMTQGFRFIEPDEAVKLLESNGSITNLFQSASEIWLEAKVIDNTVSSSDRVTNEFVKAYLNKQ